MAGGASWSLEVKLRPSGGAWRDPRLSVGEVFEGESSDEDEAEGAVSTAVTMVGSTWLDIFDMLMLL